MTPISPTVQMKTSEMTSPVPVHNHVITTLLSYLYILMTEEFFIQRIRLEIIKIQTIEDSYLRY